MIWAEQERIAREAAKAINKVLFELHEELGNVERSVLTTAKTVLLEKAEQAHYGLEGKS